MVGGPIYGSTGIGKLKSLKMEENRFSLKDKINNEEKTRASLISALRHI
jgi:hypothetical protein